MADSLFVDFSSKISEAYPWDEDIADKTDGIIDAASLKSRVYRPPGKDFPVLLTEIFLKKNCQYVKKYMRANTFKKAEFKNAFPLLSKFTK